MTEKKKRLKIWVAAGGAAVFVIALIAVTIALIASLFSGDQSENQAQQSEPQTSVQEDGEAPSTDDDDVSKSGFPATKVDADGFAEMVVTTDSREAAASAAAVLWTVDTTKTEFGEDFVNEVIPRVMNPSPDYVGPEGQIHTSNDPETGEPTYGDPVEGTLKGLHRINYNPESKHGHWWMLGDQSAFQGIVPSGSVFVAEPFEVFNETEVVELDPTLGIDLPQGLDLAPDKPGATLEQYWVRVESVVSSTHESKVRYPATLAVYCDPPEEGGICGVAAIGNGLPEQWQHH